MFPLISSHSNRKIQIKTGSATIRSSFQDILTFRNKFNTKSNPKPTVKQLNLQNSINLQTKKKVQTSIQKRNLSLTIIRSIQKVPEITQQFYESQSIKQKISKPQIKQQSNIEGVISLIRKKITSEVRTSINKNKSRKSNYSQFVKSQMFCQSLQRIQKELMKSNEKCNLFRHEFWKLLFIEFKKYHFNNKQKHQFLDLLISLIRVNFGQQKLESQHEFCARKGQKFCWLEKTLLTKHKNVFQIIKFLAMRTNHIGLQDQFLFDDLKFDLSQTQIMNLTAFVRTLCQDHLDAFAIISLYFQISVTKQLQKNSLASVEDKYLTRLSQISQMYPKNRCSISKTQITPQIMQIDCYCQPEEFFFSKCQASHQNQLKPSHYDQLKDFILEKVRWAKKDKEVLEELVKNICCTKGYGFYTQLKAQQAHDDFFFLEIVHKSIQNQPKPNLQNSLKSYQFIQYSREPRARDAQKQCNFIDEQIQFTKLKIHKIIQNQQSVLFQINDLIKSRCQFDCVDDIIDTTNSLILHILQSRREIIQVQDRLNSYNKDVIITIKLTNSIAQLYLKLKQFSVSDHFYHKIQNLIDPKTYSPLTQLFAYNKKQCSSFFSDIYGIFLEMIQTKKQKQFNFDRNYTFKSFSKDMEDLNKAILLPNGITYEGEVNKNKQFRAEIGQKIDLAIRIIARNNQIQRKQKVGPISQLENQLIFWKSFQNYDKVFNVFQSITKEYLQKSKFLLQLKADIFLYTKNYQEACKMYQFFIQLHQTQPQIDIDQPALLSVLIKYANTLKLQSQYQDALAHLQQAKSINQTIMGSKTKQKVKIYQIFGEIYLCIKEYDQALHYFNKCLEIIEIDFGRNSSHFADILYRIGYLHQEKRQYDRAIECLKETLQKNETFFGRDSTAVVQIYYKIGVLYMEKERYHKAINYLTVTYKIQAQMWGRQSLKVAKTLKILGECLQKSEQKQKGLEYLIKSLKIETKILGSDSPQVGKTLLDISFFYSNVNQLEQSLKYSMQANKIFYEVYGQHHEQTQRASKEANRIMTRLTKTNSQAADYMKVDV